jgi:uncharacterized protein (UPF0548 family)
VPGEGSAPGRVELTYREQGATCGTLPPGYRHVDRRVLLGSGQATLERAADALFRWDMHRRAGLTVAASSPTARPGSVVRLTRGWRWLSRLPKVMSVTRPDR